MVWINGTYLITLKWLIACVMISWKHTPIWRTHSNVRMLFQMARRVFYSKFIILFFICHTDQDINLSMGNINHYEQRHKYVLQAAKVSITKMSRFLGLKTGIFQFWFCRKTMLEILYRLEILYIAYKNT